MTRQFVHVVKKLFFFRAQKKSIIGANEDSVICHDDISLSPHLPLKSVPLNRKHLPQVNYLWYCKGYKHDHTATSQMLS